MPRPKKMRPDLEEHGVMLNEYGIEVGRLTLNGILVLNLTEVFFEVARWSSTHGGKCSFNHLCRTFSRSGSWGMDPDVYAAINELEDLKVIQIIDEQHIRPVATPSTALRKIPTYVTRAEVHASLEPIEGDN